MGCDCHNTSSEDPNDWVKNKELVEAMKWLDRRNEVRMEFLASLIRGDAQKSLTGGPLANSYAELKDMGASTPAKELAAISVIQTIDQMRLWAESKTAPDHPLRRLSPDDLERFISQHVVYEDVKEGDRHYRFVAVFNYEMLCVKYAFSTQDLFAVSALFGQSPEMFTKANHKFGCTIDPYLTCQPRMFWPCHHEYC